MKKEALKTKFVSELLPSFNADKLYETIEDYNDEDINSLSEVKNFLLNSARTLVTLVMR